MPTPIYFCDEEQNLKTVLITGGAGFIGCNAAERWARTGWRVVVVDDLSRRGTHLNLAWLQSSAPIEFHKIDIRDHMAVEDVVGSVRPEVILHLAAQVAVTTSLIDPRHDFEVNALGTVNLLEAARKVSPEALFLYASTNKVYGRMDSVGVAERGGRYELPDLPQGVSERQALDFHSPYGCSKGAADQYALDFHKSYGLNTVAFRQSCIYGQRQFGVEDQGWVAWFLIAALLGKAVTVFGDGKQVRDLLYVDDLVDLYESAIANPAACVGKAFNIGGGAGNTLSLNELISFIEEVLGRPLTRRFSDWRGGDQPVFVADVTRAHAALGWSPKVSVRQGLARLFHWLELNRSLLEEMAATV